MRFLKIDENTYTKIKWKSTENIKSYTINWIYSNVSTLYVPSIPSGRINMLRHTSD